MLKIYINNEEVVANNDFTINKHMLNTPSVILNNVCPKEWKENKDYSSFYHPQDYSKCKIQDETYIPAEPGTYTTITGSATIQNVSTSKLQEVLQLDGDTTQSGTPTPSSPQPINVVSGRQEVKVAGKNLLPPPSANGTTENRGITLTYNTSNEYKLSGTATSNGNIVAGNLEKLYTIQSGDYLHLNYDVLPTGTIQLVGLSDTNTQLFAITITNSNKIYNLSNYVGRKLKNFFFYVVSGVNTNNMTLKPMIVKSSSDTTYEAYKGQSYEINLGKNLYNANDTTYYSACTYVSGINTNQYKVRATGSDLVINSQVSSGSNYNASAGTLISCRYGETIYYDTGNSLFTKTIITEYNSNKVSLGFSGTNRSNGSYTPTNSTCEYVSFRIGYGSATSGTEYTLAPIIEKGSQFTGYAPYKTPIELCKIGNYTDHIFKAKDGDSVYDNLSQETKDTLTYGSWYIEKQIGKVVFNGSEAWIKSSTTSVDRFIQTTTRPGMTVFTALSNYFKNEYGTAVGTIYLDSYAGSPGRVVINFSTYNTTTIDQFKTWLSTHNTEVYYVLATPTYTEITDEELLTQLNSIKLIEGLNNVSITSPYLTAPIYIHYNFVNEETIIDLLFCGVVKNSGKISLNPREPHLTTLQILDFKDFLSSGELDGFVIYQKTILEAIQMVIGNIQDYGFVLGNVNILNPNEVIGAYSTKDKTAYDVFNYLADITQSRWTTRLIDENTVAIDFYDPTLMVEGTAIDYTQSYFENNLIDNMSYNYGSNNYRNKQVMTSNQVYSNISQAQTIVANGYQTQFPTEQPIGKINSITANNIPMTFSTFNEKDMGYVADFYYNPGDNYIESDDVRSTGEIIVIDYVAIVEGRQIITNPLEIDRIKDSTGRKGIVSRYETRNDATTSTELQKIGESYIKYKGTPEIVLTIDSRKNLWEVGQRVEFNAPVEELETEYMVRTKKINYIVSADTLFYTYELVSSFNSETEINFFDNQRAKSKGNIGEGEYISRNIDIESTANIIFYDTGMTEVQITGDNTLNSILNSPFED